MIDHLPKKEEKEEKGKKSGKEKVIFQKEDSKKKGESIFRLNTEEQSFRAFFLGTGNSKHFAQKLMGQKLLTKWGTYSS